MNRRQAVQSLLAGTALSAAAVAHDPPGVSASKLRAKWLNFVADDFVVNIWRNGAVVPLPKRELLAEIYGATVERVNLELVAGDWLVFHVVNNRLRWGGCRFFGLAALVAEKETTIVSARSDQWSYIDKPGDAARFINERDYLHDRSVHVIPPERAWDQGATHLHNLCGGKWPGQPIWGEAASTWLKLRVT